VTVVDQGPLGREASWAGAGMLPPAATSGTAKPAQRLVSASHLLWPQLSESLRAETGIDNGYCRSGGLEIRRGGSPDELHDDIEFARRIGAEVEGLSPQAAREFEPNLAADLSAAYRFPQMAQVRNPRHLKAMVAACAARGVRIVAGTPVYGFECSGEKIVGIKTNDGLLNAGQFVVSAGAWSQHILETVGCAVTTQPVRGQIVLLYAQPLPFKHILLAGKKYLVPRPDGRILVGATVERVGFNKANTAEGLSGLLDFATGLVPCLAEAKYERAWAGLRPRSADGLPYLGRAPGTENLFVATGHFRDGLQLSPITGKLMASLILGEEPVMSLEDFACDRHRPTVDVGSGL
jgi:glycine oxidase